LRRIRQHHVERKHVAHEPRHATSIHCDREAAIGDALRMERPGKADRGAHRAEVQRVE
jgi:hypothetical protein